MKKYIDLRQGEPAWAKILALAAPQGGAFEAGRTYGDQDFGAILRAACESGGLSPEHLLHDFGEFLVPGLLASYHAFLSPQWKTLDLLEYTEISMHAAARMRDPSASPPGLKCRRCSPDEVSIEYSSQRRLCPLAKGIIAGIAKFYDENITLTESKCMHRGDPHCQLDVKLKQGTWMSKEDHDR